MKSLIFSFSLCCIQLMATAQSGSIVVKGMISGDRKGDDKVYLQIGHEYEDSAQIIDDRYSFTVPFKEPVYVVITPHYATKVGYVPYGILADKPGEYTIS